MRRIGISSGMALAAAAAMVTTLGMAPPEPLKRPMRHKPQRPYETEMNRKQSRAANRSKKQYLLKGIRP